MNNLTISLFSNLPFGIFSAIFGITRMFWGNFIRAEVNQKETSDLINCLRIIFSNIYDNHRLGQYAISSDKYSSTYWNTSLEPPSHLQIWRLIYWHLAGGTPHQLWVRTLCALASCNLTYIVVIQSYSDQWIDFF